MTHIDAAGRRFTIDTARCATAGIAMPRSMLGPFVTFDPYFSHAAA